MNWEIRQGDCVMLMAAMEAESVDAIVTDPPYGLAFMGKEWDHGVPGVPFWSEALRIAKPGAHLLAFGGTRTFHRLGCAIEDAGWEIRDSIGWNHREPAFCRCDVLQYSDGIHLQNVRSLSSAMDAKDAVSSGTQSVLLDGLFPQDSGAAGEEAGGVGIEVPDLRDDVSPPIVTPLDVRADVLLGVMPEQDVCQSVPKDCSQWAGRLDEGEPSVIRQEHERAAQPGVEGRRDALPKEGKLPRDQICPSAGVGDTDGPQGPLHHGASAGDGADCRPSVEQNGSGASHQPRRPGQRAGQPGTLAVEWIAQGGGAWPGCPRCGKPLEPPFFAGPLAWNYGSGFPKSLNVGNGFGTALKPAWEPILLARKPLAGTVAQNVVAHGTGALNVDGCRIASTPEDRAEAERCMSGSRAWRKARQKGAATIDVGTGDMAMNPAGRWPANLVLDEESARALDEQSGELSSGLMQKGTARRGGLMFLPTGNQVCADTYGDSGGASRFFYTAKASAGERHYAGRNAHPTVKPVSLMRWLVRLVTPPGGLVLDPFAGSGSTGIAALSEGMRFLGMEIDPDSCAMARKRIAGPLFAGVEALP